MRHSRGGKDLRRILRGSGICFIAGSAAQTRANSIEAGDDDAESLNGRLAHGTVGSVTSEKTNFMRKLRHSTVSSAASLLLVAVLVSDADPQVTATAGYRVSVPRVATIAAPASVSIMHDETSGNQVFGAQQWTVAQNSPTGSTVTFSTSQAFTNAVAPSSKRDARLDLAVASTDSGSTWILSLPSDQTDYASANEIAKVQATSTGPGSGAFNLTVTFLTGDIFTLTSGDYTTTITATITAN